MLTASESIQEHVDLSALINENKELQGHVPAANPAESVGDRNCTTADCPLSENRQDTISGAGILDSEDRISTLYISVVYSDALLPVIAKESSHSPVNVAGAVRIN